MNRLTIPRDRVLSVFVTSDHHFSHANIIKYTNRPFADADEMDTVMASNWNGVVGRDDIVIHLGDFTLGGTNAADKFFRLLNGKIYILDNFWHHDKRWILNNTYFSSGGRYEVQTVPPIVALESNDDVFVLSHYPQAEWDRKHHGAYHLHGHSHGTYAPPAGQRILDVGVDCTNFTPITIAQAMITINTRELRKGVLR